MGAIAGLADQLDSAPAGLVARCTERFIQLYSQLPGDSEKLSWHNS